MTYATHARIVDFIRGQFREPEAFIPLHEPRFWGCEEERVIDCIRSTFVSSVGRYVDAFEEQLGAIVGARHVVATSCGTTALQVALRLVGVERDELVLVPSLSFVATANAVAHLSAQPAFVDVERASLGMSPEAVEAFCVSQCDQEERGLIHRPSGRRVAACVPMHTFGHPVRVAELTRVCQRFSIPVVEDAAESLGSSILLDEGAKHTGTFGAVGIFSFNGNKIVTAGGGGALVTDDEDLARLAKHLTTTAKIPHRWEYRHDAVGYNYRLPNLNAALVSAQLEQLPPLLSAKRRLAEAYQGFFAELEGGPEFVAEQADTRANYWLNTLLFSTAAERDAFLAHSNDHGVMTRPAWAPLHTLPMYDQCPRGELATTIDLAARLVNIPSSSLQHLVEDHNPLT